MLYYIRKYYLEKGNFFLDIHHTYVKKKISAGELKLLYNLGRLKLIYLQLEREYKVGNLNQKPKSDQGWSRVEGKGCDKKSYAVSLNPSPILIGLG